MIRELFKSRAAKLFAILTFLLFITMFTFQIINERFWLHDLEVMYSAADSFMNNEPVYGVSFGLESGFYKYSPFTLFFFMPYALLTYKVACIIHFFISLLCAVALIPLLDQIVRKHLFNYPRKYHLTLFVTIIAVLIHLVRDLHLGNINVILVFLLTLSLRYLLADKHIKFGILLAIVILTKPFFIVFVLPLLLHKKYKAIVSVAVAGALFILISMLAIGFPESIDFYFDWFAAMLDHSSYLNSKNTIFYIYNRYTGVQIGSEYAFLLLGIIAVISSVFFWLFIRTKLGVEKTKTEKNRALIIHLAILIAIVPNVFITDTEHFLFSLPIISTLILYFSVKKRFLWVPLLAFLIFLYGGNSTDMMGDYINENYKNLGILGIGNLALILMMLIIYVKNRKVWEMNSEKLDAN
jgi:hypothetical protein